MNLLSEDDKELWDMARENLIELSPPHRDSAGDLRGGDHQVHYWLEPTDAYGIIANVWVTDTGDRSYRDNWVAQILEEEGIETGYDTLTVTEDDGEIEFTTYLKDREDVEDLSYIADLAQTL